MNKFWKDKKLYWAWEGPPPFVHNKDGTITVNKTPPTPTKKRLDYVTINKGCKGEMKLCIGVWDDDKYTPLYRDELEWHLIPR